MSRKSISLGVAGLLALIALGSAACTGASRQDFEAMKAELEAVKASRAEAASVQPAPAPPSSQPAAAPSAPVPPAPVAPLSSNPQPATQPAAQPASAAPADLLGKGKLVFEKSAGGVGCAYCHGMTGKGDGTAGVGAPPNRGANETKVRNALKGVSQMSFIQLSEEEIAAVVAYLQELNKLP